jgi:hypothetical protein
MNAKLKLLEETTPHLLASFAGENTNARRE